MAEPLVFARDTPAALRSGPIRPGVETTVCCALVVPSQVMASLVPSGQPAAISILPRSAGAASAPSTTSVAGLYAILLASAAWAGATAPSRPRGVDDAQLAVPLAGERDARVGRDRGGGRHAGHDLEPDPGLGARRGVRDRAVQQRIAGEQPDRELAALGRLHQRAGGSRPVGRV